MTHVKVNKSNKSLMNESNVIVIKDFTRSFITFHQHKIRSSAFSKQPLKVRLNAIYLFDAYSKEIIILHILAIISNDIPLKLSAVPAFTTWLVSVKNICSD